MCCRQRRQSPQGQSFSPSLSIIMVPWFSSLFMRLAGSRKYPPCASSISTFQSCSQPAGPCPRAPFGCKRLPISTARHLRLRNPSYICRCLSRFGPQRAPQESRWRPCRYMCAVFKLLAHEESEIYTSRLHSFIKEGLLQLPG